MNKWLALSRAFEHYGSNIALACEYMGKATKENNRFNELYVPYVILLEIMKLTLREISNRIDVINKEEQND